MDSERSGYQMRKVSITGCGGAGKSTLAACLNRPGILVFLAFQAVLLAAKPGASQQTEGEAVPASSEMHSGKVLDIQATNAFTRAAGSASRHVSGGGSFGVVAGAVAGRAGKRLQLRDQEGGGKGLAGGKPRLVAVSSRSFQSSIWGVGSSVSRCGTMKMHSGVPGAPASGSGRDIRASLRR